VKVIFASWYAYIFLWKKSPCSTPRLLQISALKPPPSARRTFRRLHLSSRPSSTAGRCHYHQHRQRRWPGQQVKDVAAARVWCLRSCPCEWPGRKTRFVLHGYMNKCAYAYEGSSIIRAQLLPRADATTKKRIAKRKTKCTKFGPTDRTDRIQWVSPIQILLSL
jgi:hypothetical protein